eukprot:7151567-Prymnesium_polylepis.1
MPRGRGHRTRTSSAWWRRSGSAGRAVAARAVGVRAVAAAAVMVALAAVQKAVADSVGWAA